MHARAAIAPNTSLRIAFDWLLELRLWVAFCVGALGIYCQRILGDPSQASTPNVTSAVIFLSTLALYNLDQSLDGKRAGSRPEQKKHPRYSAGPSRRHHLTLSLVSVAGLFACATQLSPSSLMLLALGFVLCSSYAVPWGRGSRRLKSIPGIKAPFVGFSVAIAVIWVPLLPSLSTFSELSPDRGSLLFEAAFLTLSLGLLCTVNALLFDVPDMQEDRERGVPTAAVLRGISFNRRLCVFLCLLAASLAYWGLTKPLPIVAFAAFLIFAAVRINEKTAKRKIAFWVEGCLILPLSVLLISSVCPADPLFSQNQAQIE